MYTGNTCSIFSDSSDVSVYPCVYREHIHIKHVFYKQHGLSLCIQGTPLEFNEFASSRRFIPVYTGNTTRADRIQFHLAVYPCVYREHSRGLLFPVDKPRFIPVYTGNTQKRDGVYWTPSVYPCVYREHEFGGIEVSTGCGLSLCIQGTHFNDYDLLKSERFIPVYTGNTNCKKYIFIAWTVYPCVYREHRCLKSVQT